MRGFWRVKGLSTGHPLTRGQTQWTPQEACFLGGWGGVMEGVGGVVVVGGACCTWTDTKEGQAAGGRSAKINIKACWPCPAFVAWKWQAPPPGVDEVRGKRRMG